jgi:cytochrome c5
MNLKTRNKVVQNIAFLIILLLMSLNGFAQEEHDKHEQHRHLRYAYMKNPVAMTAQSVAEGAKLYEKHCMACHGESGIGGIGPNLTVSVRIHGKTDGEMFHVITDGVAGTAMKGFKNELTEKMR